jgi:hypothetical protein
MGLLHGGSAPCSPLEMRIGEGPGIMHMQVAWPRPGHYPSELSYWLSAAWRGMEMIGHSMIGQNVIQGVATVSWGLDVTSQDCTGGCVVTP